MFRHTLVLILRNIRRFKGMFFINLIGLSTGLACVLLIGRWVEDELQIDSFLEHGERLFQVVQDIPGEKGTSTIDLTPLLLSGAVKDEIPEVEFAVTAIPTKYNSSHGVASVDGQRIQAVAQYASEDFFQVMRYPLLYGTRDQILSDKSKIVLSDVLAVKLFGSVDGAIGKSVAWSAMDIGGVYAVSGVFQSPPQDATLQFDVALNLDVFLDKRPGLDRWDYSGPYTYIMLKDNSDPSDVSKKVGPIIQRQDASVKSTVWLQRYSDRYLHDEYENGTPSGGRIVYVRLFSLIAIFILVIACINFMNLSTAKASARIKEIGIKKAIGASRKMLMLQHLGESVVMAFISLAMAVLLADLMLNAFNELSGKQLTMNVGLSFSLVMIVITFLTGVLSGSYPSFYLSAFRPVAVLKGKIATSGGGIGIRKGLVIFQFVITVVLMMAVWIVSDQVAFLESKDIGYSRDRVIHFDLTQSSDALLNEIRSLPGVVSAGNFFHNMTHGADHGEITDVVWAGKRSDDQTGFVNLTIGYGLIETLGITVKDGQSFDPASGDANGVIFNESAIKAMGLDDPVGKTVRILDEERRIVGVVKDFHFESLHEKVRPFFFQLLPTALLPKVMVRLQAGHEKETLTMLGDWYKRRYPGFVFQHSFVDDDHKKLYASEERVSRLSRYFAGMTILISCLGLFGLSAFTAERRLKEIGVRKAVGADAASILLLLTGEFTRIVLLAIALALPLSFVLAKQWLDGFAFRITLHWWYFAGAGMTALAIAWLTVGAQAFKAARVNPVKCLRDE